MRKRRGGASRRAVLLPTWKSVPSGSRTDATSSGSPSSDPPSMLHVCSPGGRRLELREVEPAPLGLRAEEHDVLERADRAHEERLVRRRRSGHAGSRRRAR